jgi:Fibronectin type III domain
MPLQSPILVPAVVGGLVSPPGANLLTYRILNGVTMADQGGLRGVLNEPQFGFTINQGPSTLQLTLDHYPSELTYGQLVEVRHPNGTILGRWKHEQMSTQWAADKYVYQLTLTPLCAELSDADFNANYSADATQPTPPLGAQGFSQPVLAGITRTMHCSSNVVQDNGVPYSYVYNNARPVDALNQAITFGGSTWWWYCDALGRVSLRTSAAYGHVVTFGREITQGEWDEDIVNLYNGYPVMGGTPANALTSLSAFAVDTNPANPYSVVNVGRRTAQPYSDSSLLDQASVNAVAASLLAYSEQVNRQQKYRLTGYAGPMPQPGDALTIRITSTDPTLGPGGELGPFLITAVIAYGATAMYDVTVAATMSVPVAYFPANIGQAQALAKLAQNPPYVAVSADGSTGVISSGVANGSGGGAGYTAVPSTPTGLSVTTGIDSISQTNNAYVYLTWNPALSTDAVTAWQVQYRKAGDAVYYQTRSMTPAVKIGNLIPGQLYGFSVSAQNALGAYSALTTEINVSAAADTTPPAQPTGLTAARTPRGALVSWNGVADTDVQGYLLQVSVGGSGFQTINAAPDLRTSAAYTAPSGTPQQTILVFRVAAVDWSGNQSSWSTASANTPTDGTYFDEIMTGNLTATGTITGGSIQTSPTGPRVVMDNAGIRLYDGSATDYGEGPGVTTQLNSLAGTAFFSGTVSASKIITPVSSTQIAGADLDLTGIPVLQFWDGNGTTRVLVGEFYSASDGTLQYGFEVIDPTGRLLFDSVVGMCANNHFGAYASGPTNYTATTLGAVGPTVSFAIPYRQQNVYANVKGMALMTWSGSYAGQIFAISASLNGGASSANPIWLGYGSNINSGSILMPFNFYHTFYSVPVGSYTGTITAQCQGAMTLQLNYFSIDIFLLGGPNSGN